MQGVRLTWSCDLRQTTAVMADCAACAAQSTVTWGIHHLCLLDSGLLGILSILLSISCCPFARDLHSQCLLSQMSELQRSYKPAVVATKCSVVDIPYCHDAGLQAAVQRWSCEIYHRFEQ